jgi:diguanylate cyclase (GGDEF)-like protein
VFAAMLTVVLGADLALTAANRETERAWTFADIDELTGVLNRRGWNRLLQMEESRFRRFGETATVIVIDADHFSSVNDAHGRDAADRLLRAVAFVLRTTARGSDVVARLGGDEFGIIAVGTGRAEAATFVRRLEHALADTGVRFSTGAAPHTVAGGLTVAWQQAEAAMQAHKQRRRDASRTPDSPAEPQPGG